MDGFQRSKPDILRTQPGGPYSFRISPVFLPCVLRCCCELNPFRIGLRVGSRGEIIKSFGFSFGDAHWRYLLSPEAESLSPGAEHAQSGRVYIYIRVCIPFGSRVFPVRASAEDFLRAFSRIYTRVHTHVTLPRVNLPVLHKYACNTNG